LEEELSAREAAERLKAAAKFTGGLIVTAHAQREMRADGFDMNDLLSAIREGSVTGTEPTPRGEIRYRFEGPPVDRESGENVAIVFALKGARRVVVITCFKTPARPRR
jgi:hypothetical protein